MRRHLWTVLYSLALGVFTVFLALDTFVLRSDYRRAAEMNTAMFDTLGTPAPTAAPTATPAPTPAPEERIPLGYTDNSYRDENICVVLSERVVHDTHVYIAEVEISSAEYLKTAFARDTYGKNVTQKTSEIAESHGAILAVNGDYYGAQESGIVLRNGVLYRKKTKKQDILCVWADGTLEVLDGYTAKADELVKKGAWQVFCFGPGLIENGEMTVTAKTEVHNSMKSNPRTAIGMVAPGHYLFVVSDGRTDESEGLSLYELAQLLRSCGAVTAYNLDGGGSSAMVFNGRVVNKPTSYGTRVRERGVSDIVYIG